MPPWFITTWAWVASKLTTSSKWVAGRCAAAVNGQDHTLELQEIAFAVVVGFGVSWLERTLPHGKPLDANWVAAWATLAGLVTLKTIGANRAAARE